MSFWLVSEKSSLQDSGCQILLVFLKVREGKEQGPPMKKDEGGREEGRKRSRGGGGAYKLPNHQLLHFLPRDLTLLIKGPIRFRDRFPDKGVISKHCHTRGLRF